MPIKRVICKQEHSKGAWFGFWHPFVTRKKEWATQELIVLPKRVRHISCHYYNPSLLLCSLCSKGLRASFTVKDRDGRDYGCNGKNPGLVSKDLRFSLGVLLPTTVRCWASHLTFGSQFFHL